MTNQQDTPFKVLAIIPARSGSKGIPGKNIRLLVGKPLLAHTIEQACAATQVSRVVVSTDGQEIAQVAQQYGAEVIWRPDDLSGDTASSESALIHALSVLEEQEEYSPDLIVFLQCTSPIRHPDDIDRAVQKLLDTRSDALVSVVRSHRFYWREVGGQGESINYDYRQRPRRQDREPEYQENGSIYVFKPWVLKEFKNRLGGKIALYEMDAWSAIDIDDPEDFALCEWILQHKGTSEK
jgi:CMP-N,N'-diacetyllegionaminic acid synthase